jgi:hypothetical protein
MRSRLGILVLLFVGACGNNSNITNPPGALSFTLTVNGSGTGSGHVVTPAGTSPAIDCLLAVDAGTTGVCSGAYPESTSVSITVSPDSGTTFTGWGGDASSCGGAATCSIVMSQNKTATAQLTRTPTNPTPSVSIRLLR